MALGQVDILMYHSISEATGPTSIDSRTFAVQIEALAATGLPTIALDNLLKPSAPRSIVVTFDDGFCDFDEVAWPILRDHGIRPIVYLPSGCMGGEEDWNGANMPRRPLMGWDRVEALAGEGVIFGAHSVTHSDLSTLEPLELEREIVRSGQEINDRIGLTVRHFAPPYGSATPAVRRCIAQNYLTSVGTKLGIAGPKSDIHDLPRLEMYYFTDPARWQAHLDGRGRAYLNTRRTLRQARQIGRRLGLG